MSRPAPRPAKKLFERADGLREAGDAPGRFYARYCESLMSEGKPPAWKPVIDVRK